MLRLTDTRGSRSCPAAAHASRNSRICSAWSSWNGTPASSVSSVDDIRFMPCWPVHSAVARDPAPHQIRSRSPGECGSGRSSPGGFGNIGDGLGSANPVAGQRLEEDLGVLAGHVGVGLALGRRVAEVAEAIDDLLGRAAADPELEPAARDEVGGAGVLDHVQRVLVAHVDDGRPDLDALGPGADRRQERERRRELLGEMVDPEVGAVGTQVLDRLGELDRLDERVRARPDLRVGRRRPMPEREEPDLLHRPNSTVGGRAGGSAARGRRSDPRGGDQGERCQLRPVGRSGSRPAAHVSGEPGVDPERG